MVIAVARKKAMHELAGSGDDGTTGLLGGGRTAKDDLRLEAYGTVDEASSAIGLARVLAGDDRVRSICVSMQRGLYKLGAELATDPNRRGRFATMEAADVAALDQALDEIEAEVTMPSGFVLPGAAASSAALDLARTIVRRAERRCVTLRREGGLANAEVGRYLNRLSLLLFVLGRYEEERMGVRAPMARDD